MFGTLGGPEVILILVVALIVFGPRRLPEIGKSMGKMLAEFRKASNDFKRTIEDELEAEKSRESQATPIATPETPPVVTDVTATDATTTDATAAVAGGCRRAGGRGPLRLPLSTGADTSGTPESEPKVERPAEPVVSRGRSGRELGRGPDGRDQPGPDDVPRAPGRAPGAPDAQPGRAGRGHHRLLGIPRAHLPLPDPAPAQRLPGSQVHHDGADGSLHDVHEDVVLRRHLPRRARTSSTRSGPSSPPGLYAHEKAYAVPFIVAGIVLLPRGGGFGHYILFPTTFKFLYEFAGDDMQFLPKVDEYFEFYSWFLLGLGLVFQIPVVIFVLARIGLVTPGFLMRQFKFAVLVSFVIAAIITPSADVVNQTMLALPMMGLYLLGVLVAWIFGRARRKPEDPKA
jgi:TatA/E family protein of Tat protein translocase